MNYLLSLCLTVIRRTYSMYILKGGEMTIFSHNFQNSSSQVMSPFVVSDIQEDIFYEHQNLVGSPPADGGPTKLSKRGRPSKAFEAIFARYRDARMDGMESLLF